MGNGGVFAVLAMALVVTYRSSGVLNFATGAQALYAAYTYSLLRNGQLLQPIPRLTARINIGTDLGSCHLVPGPSPSKASRSRVRRRAG